MAEYVPLDIDRGADFSTQIVWTDAYDQPMALVEPAQLDIRTSAGVLILSLSTETTPPVGEPPELAVVGTMGLIQIYIRETVTEALTPGVYVYDLFVEVDDADAYAGTQRVRLIEGPCVVHQRITAMP